VPNLSLSFEGSARLPPNPRGTHLQPQTAQFIRYSEVNQIFRHLTAMRETPGLTWPPTRTLRKLVVHMRQGHPRRGERWYHRDSRTYIATPKDDSGLTAIIECPEIHYWISMVRLDPDNAVQHRDCLRMIEGAAYQGFASQDA
jgi:hypothetical protein